jgi:RNA polymerase sigma-70 factor (ECF subfamily)
VTNGCRLVTTITHQDGLTELHQRYAGELVAYARRLLGGDRAAAEDIVQEAFIATHRVLRDNPHHELLPRPWLYRLVHNAAIDELRTAHRRHVIQDRPAVVDDRGAARGPYGVLADRTEFHDTLTRIAALPERQRDALLMHAVHGLDHRHVGAALGITHGASRVLVHRARRAL